MDVTERVLVQVNRTLSAPDYAVFAMVLALSVAIGIWYGCTGGKQKTTSEYLLADRQMHWLPVTLSLLASFMSAITLLGTPAEIYKYGTIYWFIWIGYVIMMPFVTHVFLPVFFRLKVTSVFEYLERRFSVGVRICAAIAYTIQMVLYMSIVLYAPSLALNAVTGFSVWIGVFSVGVVCTFYTTVGGMKAVMWTDSFQILMMFAGLIAVLVQGSIDQHGFGNIWRDLESSGRVEWANWNPSPLVRHTTWSLAFGGCFTWLPIYGVNQAQMQRAISVPKLKHAQIAMWLNVPGLTGLLTICALCGTVVYSEYKNCDPLLSGRITAADQLLPLYVMDRLYYAKGLPGLFTACLFSGALSTVSSGINSLSAVFLEDFIVGLCYPNMTEARKTIVSKCLAVLFGAICLAMTFVAAELGGLLQAALAIFGMIGGPQLGLFFLGIMWPCANKWGAYAGFFTSLIFAFWLGIGAQIYKTDVYRPPVSIAGCIYVNTTDNFTTMATMSSTMAGITETTEAQLDPTEMPGYLAFYAISYIWYGALAAGIVVIVGLLVSLATGPTKGESLDPRLIIPVFDVFFCWLPESLRKRMRCGVDYSKMDDYDDDYDDKIKISQTNSHPREKKAKKEGQANKPKGDDVGHNNPGFQGGTDYGYNLRNRVPEYMTENDINRVTKL